MGHPSDGQPAHRPAWTRIFGRKPRSNLNNYSNQWFHPVKWYKISTIVSNHRFYPSNSHEISKVDINSSNRCVWRCWYLWKKDEGPSFRSLVLPVLLYSCETWTLSGDLNERLNFFSTMDHAIGNQGIASTIPWLSIACLRTHCFPVTAAKRYF